MRHVLLGLLGVGLSAGAAQATVVDIVYDFSLQVTDVYFTNPQSVFEPDCFPDRFPFCFPYEGPLVGEVFSKSYTITADTELESFEDYPNSFSYIIYDDFDPDTGAIRYAEYTGLEEIIFDLTGQGPPILSELFELDGGTLFLIRESNILEWTATPDVPPVPLPASLPLLGMGLAGIAGFRVTRRGRI